MTTKPRVEVPDLVELWTFQPRSFYEHLCEHGVSWDARPDFEDDPVLEGNNQWLFAYNWLTAQMKEKGVLSTKVPEPKFPVWTWFWWYGEAKKKPDLRYYSSWAHRKEEGCVLLKLLVPKEYVCITDYTGWHNVLNHCYFSDNEADDDAFDAEVLASGYPTPTSLMGLPSGPVRDKMEKSWQRVFDINAEPDDFWFRPFETRFLQATMFAVSKEHVKGAWWLPPKGQGRVERLPNP